MNLTLPRPAHRAARSHALPAPRWSRPALWAVPAAMGGFTGGDPAMTVDRLRELGAGELRRRGRPARLRRLIGPTAQAGRAARRKARRAAADSTSSVVPRR
ncbi:hypothetical protein [Nonomuraea wenchangensis]|uniref:hypothetical protein n=1 Tax=Nonomuraea wenchangensis TaxID=568860 RepID=UPI0033F8071C